MSTNTNDTRPELTKRWRALETMGFAFSIKQDGGNAPYLHCNHSGMLHSIGWRYASPLSLQEEERLLSHVEYVLHVR